MKYNMRLCAAIEKKLADDHKFLGYVPDDFVIENEDNKKNEYFKQFGYKVPNYVKELYYRYNGIASDKYISTELYLFHIFPYLVSRQMMFAYIDKNNYEMIFPDVPQPKIILRNQNGYMSYGKAGGYKLVDMETAVKELSKCNEFIIKPSNDSGGGKGVRKITMVGGVSKQGETIEDILKAYKQDYVVQEVVAQYEGLNRLNKNSLNTMRIITYRRNDSSFVSLGAFIRFGIDGAEVDSGARGGLICKVEEDGLINDRIFYLKSFMRGSLKSLLDVENLYIPNFGEVLDFCYSLHSKLNYFDLCGWDIAIGQDGKPVFIELNQYPDCESFQMVNGPFFGDYTDEVMEKVSKNKTQFTLSIRREFESNRMAEFWLADL
ncbi:MAG: hypothetical protein J6S89_02720 [Paludibacteraceae bacterium]|nr:hypothetical protein [Paludibacteraceae bacterium]